MQIATSVNAVEPTRGKVRAGRPDEFVAGKPDRIACIHKQYQ